MSIEIPQENSVSEIPYIGKDPLANVDSRNVVKDNDVNKLSKKDENVSPALLAALFRKQSDRIFVTQLESSIVAFINSENQTFVLNPMNSYYRLLSHQVAEYHYLKHTVARSSESNAVLLFKGSVFLRTTRNPLLQELKSEDFDLSLLVVVESPTSSELLKKLPQDTSRNVTPKNTKKFKILRRESSDTFNNKGVEDKSTASVNVSSESLDNSVMETNEKSTLSLEEQRLEKERQYEQLKLRIFEDSNDHNEIDNNENPGKEDSNLNSGVYLDKNGPITEPKNRSNQGERSQAYTQRNNNFKTQYNNQGYPPTGYTNMDNNFNIPNIGYPMVQPMYADPAGYIPAMQYHTNGAGYMYQAPVPSPNFPMYYMPYTNNSYESNDISNVSGKNIRNGNYKNTSRKNSNNNTNGRNTSK